MLARCTHAFDSTVHAGWKPEHLAMRVGDEIVLEESPDDKNWWKGHVHGGSGSSGHFPKVFVQRMEPEPAQQMDAAHAYQMDEAEAQRQLRAIPSDQKRHCVSYPGWDQLSWNQRLFVARNPGVLAPAPAPRRPPGGERAGAPRGAQPPAPAPAGARAEEGVPPTTGLLNILLTSRVLRAALPDVRRRALAESVREAATAEAAIDILLENVASSPYLPQERKDPLAELAMTHQFDALAAALQCDQALSPGPTSTEEEFRAIRDMVVAVFTRSRKMAALPAARRRELGAAIHAQTTAESIKMLALSALETSQAFDGAARDMVANDVK